MPTPDLSGARWRKSSRSNGNGGACVEVGFVPAAETWRSSSRSSAGANNCVEVGFAPAAVAVRDTKDRDSGTLAVSSGEWSSFLARVKQGAYDLR